jgi:hypothetical protein
MPNQILLPLSTHFDAEQLATHKATLRVAIEHEVGKLLLATKEVSNGNLKAAEQASRRLTDTLLPKWRIATAEERNYGRD